MTSGTDWPAWINATTVVVLAGITAYYARTTSQMLRQMRLQHEAQFSVMRQPITNALDQIERLLQLSTRAADASIYSRDFDLLDSDWIRFTQSIRDIANEEVRRRSEPMYRVLEDLHDAVVPIRVYLIQSIGALRSGTVHPGSQQAAREKVELANARLTRSRAELVRYI